jgi:hypothetical protein
MLSLKVAAKQTVQHNWLVLDDRLLFVQHNTQSLNLHRTFTAMN